MKLWRVMWSRIYEVAKGRIIVDEKVHNSVWNNVAAPAMATIDNRLMGRVWERIQEEIAR